ncbi:CBS domain-containing protein [Streptomyces sp. NPDC049597]|uniref:CBS domain-containing protein n=1 Tax=Streptomyces sp. NPDC049597 TaxID=3155276 RepID=UPI00343F791C
MTPVQTQPHPTNTATNRSVVEAVNEAGPQVWGDMTVEVALSVMASARAGCLILCDEDGRCTGLVTRAQLTAARDSSSYTDRIRLRDVLDDGPGTSTVTTMAEYEQATRQAGSERCPSLAGRTAPRAS